MHHQDDNQPTASPVSPVADRGHEPGEKQAPFIPNGRTVPMGNALMWISDAWGMFKQRGGLWAGFILVYAVLLILLKYMPFAAIITVFMQLLLIAGVIHSCDVLRREESLSFGDLFAGFKRKTGPLVIVGLIGSGFAIIVMITIAVLLGGDAIRVVTNQPLVPAISSLMAIGITPGMIFAGAIFIIGRTLCTMAFWFTSTLVMMHDIPPFRSLRMSFSACRKNILPGAIFFLVMIILMIILAWVAAFWMDLVSSSAAAGITPKIALYCAIIMIGGFCVLLLWIAFSLVMDSMYSISLFKALRMSFSDERIKRRPDSYIFLTTITLIGLGEVFLHGLFEISLVHSRP